MQMLNLREMILALVLYQSELEIELSDVTNLGPRYDLILLSHVSG